MSRNFGRGPKNHNCEPRIPNAAGADRSGLYAILYAMSGKKDEVRPLLMLN